MAITTILIAVLYLLHSATGQLSLSDCTDGFISQDLSTALQSGSLTVPYEQQRVIPGISFNCSGVITSWTIGAEWRTDGRDRDFFPHLQIWRSASCANNAFVLVGDVELFVAGGEERPRDDYVFSGNPDPPLEFEAGDILGIFQPRNSRSRVGVYYDTSAGTTNYYIDTRNANQPPVPGIITTSADGTEDSLPLVTIEIGPSTSTDYDLFDEADLTTALQSTSLTIPYGQQRILPDIPSNCSGSLTSWTVGAEWRTDGNHTLFPHLQIWRSVMEGCSYTLIGDTELFVSGGAERPRDDYIFSGTPDPAVGFQKGDILGTYQPRDTRARVRVYYDTSTGPSSYYNDIGGADVPPMVQDQDDFEIIAASGIGNGLPLLAIQIAIDCDPLEDPENGTVAITAIATDSLTATYSCLTGFDLVGEEVRSCDCQNTGGMWTGMVPTCMLIDCGGLTAPDDGQISFTSGVAMTIETGLDAVASYTCSVGYNLVGDAMRTCQANEEWDGTEPTCMLINCGLLPLLSEGQIAYTPGVVSGLETGLNAMASYSCSEGYNLVGDMTRTCQANGEWDGGETTCMLIDCGGPIDPEDGDVTVTPGVGSIQTGLYAVATYTCSEGYDLVGSAVRTCQANDQWDVAAPNCMLIDCGGLGVPENGQVIISPGLVTMTGVGAVATYTCNTSAGLMLVGTVMRTCQDSGQWSGMVPECIRCNTDSITNPESGAVAITSPGGVITASYSCDVGYELVGVASRTCQSDGQFSGQEPVCQVIDCGEPPSVDGGGFNVTETTFQSLARYGCNEGFTLSGSQSRTCQADGTWSGTDPVCVAPTNAIQLGPVVGGAAAGLVVVALVTMAIIFGTVHVCKRKRRKHSTNDIQSKAFNRRSDQAALTQFHNPEIDIETSGNEAYITSAEIFPNEAYITSAETFPNEAYDTKLATSLNKAYGALHSTDDNGADEYNYINPQTISSGEGNDEPAIELYDYVRGEFTQTHT